MFKKIIGSVIRFKWAIVVFWLLLAGVVFLFTPNLSSLLNSDQAAFLPQDADSVKADRLSSELFKDKGGRSTAVIVIRRENGLTDEDRAYLKALNDFFDKNRGDFFISEINSPFKNKELEKEMYSKDGKAALLSLSLSIPSYNVRTNETAISIKNAVGAEQGKRIAGAPSKPEGLEAAVTGDAVMSQEENENINRSMDLTVKITIVLVLIILIIIYRSPFAPFVSLLTIGVSFIVSRGIIALMAEAGYRISSFTETFLIAVLFGAGTDYCLLFISRFKEELNVGKPHREALGAAFPNTGAAVLSSGCTVLVGFLFMVFARFGLFNATGPSVAIGMAVTLIAVMSLLPAILAIFGERIFWPGHLAAARAQPRAVRTNSPWNRIAASVTSKPVRHILISLLVLLPFFIAAGWSSRSYDQLKELPASTGSIRGFEIMKQSFSQGEMMPVKIVMKTAADAWSAKSLETIDEIAGNLAKADNVLKVRTATRPLGDKLTEASLPGQIRLMTEGIGELKDGLAPVADGLEEMGSGIDRIAEGTARGGGELQTLAEGTDQAASGIKETQKGLGSLSAGIKPISDGLKQINQNLEIIKNGLGDSKTGLDGISGVLLQTRSLMDKLMGQMPELAANGDFLQAYGSVKGAAEGLGGISAGLEKSGAGMDSLNSGIAASKAGLGDIKSGLDRAGASLAEIEAAMREMSKGQSKAGSDIGGIAEKLSEIAKGLSDSRDALKKMGSALDELRDASGEYSDADSPLSDVFFLPPEVLDKYPDFKEAMENYISPDGDGIILEVVLSIPPFTETSLNTIDELKRVVRDSIKGTPLEGSEFHIGGGTAVLSEVRDITSKDFTVVMCLVLLGIFIVLVILLRSLVAPVYLILTIIFSYITTMGISYLVFQVLLGYDGLHWTVQFFSFCVLVALGVDYNIFLMSRIKEEYRPGDTTGSVTRALASTGGIITSCGIIMAGTFGAMMASPIRPLLEVGFAATVGLLLDTFVIRCLMVPAIAVKFGEVSWWPGRKLKVIPVIEETKKA
jgi:RND superfamily putative drug exporter